VRTDSARKIGGKTIEQRRGGPAISHRKIRGFRSTCSRADGRPLPRRHPSRHCEEPTVCGAGRLPTLVEIAGGPKGAALKKQIEAGQYPGIVRTTLDGINQIEYLSGRSEKSAREFFFYFSSATPSAVRYRTGRCITP